MKKHSSDYTTLGFSVIGRVHDFTAFGEGEREGEGVRDKDGS